MRRFGLSVLLCLLALAGTRISGDLRAAELRRGPYLQIATPDSITIRWRTDSNTPSQVNYGLSATNLTLVATDPDPKTEHEVTLTGLEADTLYYYAVGSPDETLAGGVDHHFITPPTVGQAKPARIWVIGDSGSLSSGYGNPMAVRDAYYQFTGARHTDVWLALGDNAYDSGTDPEYQTNYFGVYAEMLRQTAAWSTIGNHETYSVPRGQVFPYLNIFSFPTNGEAGGVASGTEKYYSFDHGNIHFICLDSMTQSRATNGPMAEWLRADLAATTNSWIIAFWHHAAYSRGSHVSDIPYEIEMYEMRQNIVPILEAGGVDLVLAGHSHIYERSFFLHGHYGVSSTLQPEMMLDQGSGRPEDTGAYIKATAGPQAKQGTVYLTVGCSSGMEDSNGHHPAMFFDELQLGSLVVDVDGDRLDARFLRETGAIDDHFTIIRGEPEALRLLPLTIKNWKVSIRWKSVAGRRYSIERHANWSAQGWETVGGPITATGATSFWTNDMNGAEANFYRVVELPPSPTAPGKDTDGTTEMSPRVHRPPATERRTTTSVQLSMVTAAERSQLPKAPFDKEGDPGRNRAPEAVLAETTGRTSRTAKSKSFPQGWTTTDPNTVATAVIASQRENASSHAPWLKQTRQRG